MSKNPYCEKCGFLFHVHSDIYCAHVENLQHKAETAWMENFDLRRENKSLKAELETAIRVRNNTARTVQAFRKAFSVSLGRSEAFG